MPPSRWAPLAALWSAAHRYAAATVSGDGQRAAALRAGLGDHSADPGAARRALEHLAVVPLDELPAAAAVYLIAERGGPRRYVGLARDVAARFHTEPFGHLCEQNSTRSRELVAGPFDVAVEVYDDADDLHLATSEVFWWLVGRNAGLDMVNSTATLGRVGAAEGAPIVACELASGRYRVFRCTSDAARRLRIPAGQISR